MTLSTCPSFPYPGRTPSPPDLIPSPGSRRAPPARYRSSMAPPLFETFTLAGKYTLGDFLASTDGRGGTEIINITSAPPRVTRPPPPHPPPVHPTPPAPTERPECRVVDAAHGIRLRKPLYRPRRNTDHRSCAPTALPADPATPMNASFLITSLRFRAVAAGDRGCGWCPKRRRPWRSAYVSFWGSSGSAWTDGLGCLRGL